MKINGGKLSEIIFLPKISLDPLEFKNSTNKVRSVVVFSDCSNSFVTKIVGTEAHCDQHLTKSEGVLAVLGACTL